MQRPVAIAYRNTWPQLLNKHCASSTFRSPSRRRRCNISGGEISPTFFVGRRMETPPAQTRVWLALSVCEPSSQLFLQATRALTFEIKCGSLSSGVGSATCLCVLRWLLLANVRSPLPFDTVIHTAQTPATSEKNRSWSRTALAEAFGRLFGPTEA